MTCPAHLTQNMLMMSNTAAPYSLATHHHHYTESIRTRPLLTYPILYLYRHHLLILHVFDHFQILNLEPHILVDRTLSGPRKHVISREKFFNT